MAHSLSWYIPQQILYLSLEGQLTVPEMKLINDEVTAYLENAAARISIVIDASELQVGYQTANSLRDTQQYMNHIQLQQALVVATSKLNRLIALLAFSRSRARFIQFDNFDDAKTHLNHQGYNIT